MEYLGHADPGFTLRVYTHLLPSSHERTRKAVDTFFGTVLEGLDGPDADQEPERAEAIGAKLE